MFGNTFDYEACNIIKLSTFIGEHASKVSVSIPVERGFYSSSQSKKI